MTYLKSGYKSYLVTGGAGFIGLAFVKLLLQNHPDARIVVLDKLTYAAQKDEIFELESSQRIQFIKGDICDADAVKNAMASIDVVINFAAESHVDRSIDNSLPFVYSNTYGVQVLLESALSEGVKTFIQVSTDEVYGSIISGSWDENYPVAPNSPYAASKAAGDLLALAFHKTHGLDIRITRCANNYGPGQYPEKLIPKSIHNLFCNIPIEVYGDGENIREWIFVEDHCRAILAIINKGTPGTIYNIGSGNEKTNNEISRELIRLAPAGVAGTIKYIEDRKGHDYRYSLDFSRLAETGFQLEWDFDSGLRETFNWYWSKLEAGENSNKSFGQK